MRQHSAFAKRDSNHDELVAVYQSLHCGVIDLHEVGFGMPDILVHFSGYCCPVEIKSEDGQLEPSQKRFIAEWKGPKIEVVRCRDDVIAHVQRIRRKQATGQ